MRGFCDCCMGSVIWMGDRLVFKRFRGKRICPNCYSQVTLEYENMKRELHEYIERMRGT